MSADLAKSGQQLARKVHLFQSLVALLMASLFTLTIGPYAGFSALCGGLICLIPSLIFAYFAFKDTGARKIKQVVRNFNQGAKFKLLLTIILFVAAYKGLAVDPLPTLVTYFVVLVVQWPTIFTLRTNSNKEA